MTRRIAWLHVVLACASAAGAGAVGSAADARSVPDEAAPVGLERLVRDLGAADTNDRAAAAQALAALGPAGRLAVRAAAVAGEPAAAAPAGRQWNRMRWLSAGPVDDPTLAALMAPIGDPATQAKWEDVIRRHGGDTVLLLAELANTAGQRTPATRALLLLLSRVEPVEVAAAIARVGDADMESARRLLRAASDEELDLSAHQRICQVNLLLWLYEDALDAARRGWRKWKDEALVQVARTAVRRGRIEARLRAMLEDAAQGREHATRASDCAFLARVASGTPAMKDFEARLRFDNIRVFPPRDLEVLVDAFNDSELPGGSLRLLRAATHPHALYLRAVSRRAARDAEGAAADADEARRRAEALSGEGRETALFELGELMERHGDSDAAIAAWESVLARGSGDTVPDANAALRLAKQAEARRDFGRAADLYQRALDIGRRQGSSITAGGAQSAFVGWEWLGRHIEELRRQAGEGTSHTPAPATP